jgi:hypothetical protein
VKIPKIYNQYIIRNKSKYSIKLIKKNYSDSLIILLITPKQEEKLFKFILMIVFPKSILNFYLGVSTPLMTNSKNEIFINFAPIINKNIERLIEII